MRYLVVTPERRPASASEVTWSSGPAEEIIVDGNDIQYGKDTSITVIGDGGRAIAVFAPGEWAYAMAVEDNYCG